MADFASVRESSGITRWINLDYVLHIVPGLDPREPTSVTFTRGRSLTLPRAEGQKLIAQLNQCCKKSKA